MRPEGEKPFPGTEAERPTDAGVEKEESIEMIEFVTFGELMGQIGTQVSRVVDTLDKERDLAAEIRKAGGSVTRETADRITALEKQKNGLLEAYKTSLEPVRKEGFMAHFENEELLIPKPEDIDALMASPDEMEISDEDLIEVQELGDVKLLEVQLQEEADRAQEEMVGVIERMHEIGKEESIAPIDLGDMEARKAYKSQLMNRQRELEENLKHESKPEMVAELKQITSELLPILNEDIDAASATEQEEMRKKANDLQLKRLQSQFDDLHGYVTAINGRLEEVRLSLGFADKGGEQSKAA